MKRLVLKFGGTSVGTIEKIKRVANIIKKRFSEGNEIIVIVSAMAGVTDELKKIGGKAKLRLLEKDYPFTTQNGNIIFDTDFGVIDRPLITLNKINNIAGIIDLGVFIDEGNVFYKANRDSSVQVFEV